MFLYPRKLRNSGAAPFRCESVPMPASHTRGRSQCIQPLRQPADRSPAEARMGSISDTFCLAKIVPLNQAVDALGGFSIDEGGIFLLFRIHSAARCSASSSCSMVIDLLTWFLARVICSLAIRNHIYACTRSFGLARRAA